MIELSPIASPAAHLRTDYELRPDGMPWGATVHTTGSGIAAELRRRLGRRPTVREVGDRAVEIYTRPGGNGPGYVIYLDGHTVQVAEDNRWTWHVGGQFRELYLHGDWEALCPKEFVRLWRAAWPGRRSPQHLFPGESANAAYVGIEMTPVTGVDGVLPAAPGQTFSEAQYGALARLLVDLGRRHGWPAAWWTSSRLVGHEDVGPLGRDDRCDEGGGWDPGFLRPRPYLDRVRVRADVGRLWAA